MEVELLHGPPTKSNRTCATHTRLIKHLIAKSFSERGRTLVLAYQEYKTKNPLDRLAAKWAAVHMSQLSVDASRLLLQRRINLSLLIGES